VTASRQASTWREATRNDPLGIATHRTHEADEPPLGSPESQRADVLRLVAVVALIIGLGFLAGVGETVLVVLFLILCIVAHEFGHFVAAKTGGVKVTEFFVGFGPRLWSVTRGETEYGVKALPLGGYCRIIGMNNLEEVDPADEARTYRHASFGRRLTIDVAGSATHFIIAFLLLFTMFFWTGDNSRYLSVPTSQWPIAQISTLASGPSPAQAAGFKLGDRIVSIDGHQFSTWEAIIPYIQSHAGQRLNVVVDRGGRQVHLYPVPVDLAKVRVTSPGAPPSANVGFIGIGPGPPTIHSSFTESISHAGGAFVQAGAQTFDALGRLVSFHGISSYFHMLSNQKAADNPNSTRFESPVGVVRILHQATQNGLATVLWIVALINIFIGIFNLLPIFPLDGGRIAVAFYERLRGRAYRVDMANVLPAFYLGLGLILFIGVSALFLDLRDLAV
jgi:membrane-associated protease RseP (regulator of RpoE activity)